MKESKKIAEKNPTHVLRQSRDLSKGNDLQKIVSDLNTTKDQIIETGEYLEHCQKQNGHSQYSKNSQRTSEVLMQHNIALEKILDDLVVLCHQSKKSKYNHNLRSIFISPYVRGLT